MQEEVIVEVLLESRVTVLVISSEFVKKQRFRLKKIKNPIYIRNVNKIFNKKRPRENTVEVNIFYKEYRKRIEIDVTSGQKWSIILGMLWLVYYNHEINWRIREVRMKRCSENIESSKGQRRENYGSRSRKKRKRKKKKKRSKKRKRKNQKRKIQYK